MFSIESPKYGKYEVLVDKDDLDRVLLYKWRLSKRKTQLYAITWTPMINNKRKVIRLHNFIMGSLFIDHINGNGLDNRKCNLRLSTSTTNNQNKNSYRGTSKYKGVFLNKQVESESWIARIVVNKKQIYLGSFKNQELAGIAYNEAALKYFGQFANLNVITGGELSVI